ncbi:MAG: aldo/keto reductase [Anaerolineaceae bacterium]|nr:aldo/keto reductase [Anaerolineaceae bacterium]
MFMEYRTLGRTGLRVSVMGLGAGGPSRLGQRDNVNTESESANILRQALDSGVNFIDTAQAYGTEGIVGQAIAGRDRSSVIISTKKSVGSNPITRDELRTGLENSLRQLGTDYIDVYHLHGVAPENYAYCRSELVPVMQDMQQQGKIRFIGVTEAWNSDLSHEMLKQALQDDVWDVMMIGFNVLNQTARDTVLVPAMQQNIGTLIMFAVRLALSRSDRLSEEVQKLIEQGQIDPAEIDIDDPLGFALSEGGAISVPDAAYRFCREEPGTHVILSGTGNPAHLQDNLASFERPPLPESVMQRMKHIFRNVDSVTGQ